MQLECGLVLHDAESRLIRLCDEEYAYYDGIATQEPNSIEPIDIIATVAINSRVNGAAAIRTAHRGLAARCDSALASIPATADLLSFDPELDHVRVLLHEAVQVPGVLIPVATKVLHRKRRGLIPILDNVILAKYLQVTGREKRWNQTQSKASAAAVAVDVLRLFRADLEGIQTDLRPLAELLRRRGTPLTLVRILEALIWMEVEPIGYYRA